MRKKLIAGNWKMHGSQASTLTLIQTIQQGIPITSACEIAVFPPSIFIDYVRKLVDKTPLQLGCQNISQYSSGAYTGEISAAMAQEFGCAYCLVGHSERRQLFQESDQVVFEKFNRVLESTMRPILCVGETSEQRSQGLTEKIVWNQIQYLIDKLSISAFDQAAIAYEPLWAIGTGQHANPKDASLIHQVIRQHLASYQPKIAAKIPILYGGSVNQQNAEGFLQEADIDGLLIGGASLKGTEFAAICQMANNYSTFI